MTGIVIVDLISHHVIPHSPSPISISSSIRSRPRLIYLPTYLKSIWSGGKLSSPKAIIHYPSFFIVHSPSPIPPQTSNIILPQIQTLPAYLLGSGSCYIYSFAAQKVTLHAFRALVCFACLRTVGSRSVPCVGCAVHGDAIGTQESTPPYLPLWALIKYLNYTLILLPSPNFPFFISAIYLY